MSRSQIGLVFAETRVFVVTLAGSRSTENTRCLPAIPALVHEAAIENAMNNLQRSLAGC